MGGKQFEQRLEQLKAEREQLNMRQAEMNFLISGYETAMKAEKEKKDEKYKGHDRILDVENAQEFGQYEFLDALKLMGVVKDI